MLLYKAAKKEEKTNIFTHYCPEPPEVEGEKVYPLHPGVALGLLGIGTGLIAKGMHISKEVERLEKSKTPLTEKQRKLLTDAAYAMLTGKEKALPDEDVKELSKAMDITKKNSQIDDQIERKKRWKWPLYILGGGFSTRGISELFWNHYTTKNCKTKLKKWESWRVKEKK